MARGVTVPARISRSAASGDEAPHSQSSRHHATVSAVAATPRSAAIHRRFAQARVVAVCGAAFASLTLAGFAAEPPDSLLQAIRQAPALAAAEQRVQAARARLDSAGRLADAEIEGMASRANMNPDREMWEVTVRQPLPKRGERAADRERAQAAIALAQADFAAMAAEIAADVALALAESEAADARVRVLTTQLGRMDAVSKSIEARLAAGVTGRIADRLTLQSRVAALQLMLEQERRSAQDAHAEVRGRLGLAPAATLPGFTAPVPAEISADEAPAIRLASARGAEADAMAKLARASANPTTSVGLRLEREQSSMGNDDMIGIAFSSEIPWRSRRYARADVRAAEADRAAAQSDARATRFRITTALSRVERAERLADLARRLAQETRTRSETELDAFIRTAGTTENPTDSSVLQAVEILEKVTETELQVIQAETAARTARAELWRYAPAQNFFH